MKRTIALLFSILLVCSMIITASADGLPLTGEVISKQTSLRSGAGTSSSRIRYLSNGEVFDILSTDGNGWYYVAYTDPTTLAVINGWVSEYYIVTDPYHIVLRESDSAYAAPTLTNKRIGSVSAYDRYTVIAEAGNYYLISFRDAAAFISKNTDLWIEEVLMPGMTVIGTATVISTASAYAYSDTSKTAVKQYTAGTVLYLYAVQGEWAVVQYKTDKNTDIIAYVPLASVTVSYY